MIVIITSPWRNRLAQTVSTRKVRGSTPLGDANLESKKSPPCSGLFHYMNKDYVNLKLLVTTDAIPYDPVACNDAVNGPAEVYETDDGAELVDVKLAVPNVQRYVVVGVWLLFVDEFVNVTVAGAEFEDVTKVNNAATTGLDALINVLALLAAATPNADDVACNDAVRSAVALLPD